MQIEMNRMDSNEDDHVSQLYLASLALMGSLGGMIYGYNVSSEAYLKQISKEMNLGSAGSELISASATISDAISMVFAGKLLLDKYGRRFAVTTGAAFNVVGSILGGFSTNLTEVVICRLLQGVGNGISFLAVPLLVSECSPVDKRGFLVSFFQVGVIIGFMMPIVVQLAIADWQWTFALGATPGILLSILLILIWEQAESKSWLLLMNRDGEGFAAIRSSEMSVGVEDGVSDDGDDDGISEVSSDGTDGDQVPSFFQGVLLAVLMAFTNNSSDAMIFYGPNIVEMAGIGEEGSLWTALILAAVNVPAVLIVLSLVHKLSRRSMMLSGLLCVILCYFVIGFTLFFNPKHIYGLIFAGFLCLTVGYQFGPGTIFVMVLPELFTQQTRANGVMFGSAAMSIFSILCNGSMLSTFEALGGGSSDDQIRNGAGKTFLLYASVYTVCLGYLYHKLPETKHRRIVHM